MHINYFVPFRSKYTHDIIESSIVFSDKACQYHKIDT